MKRFRRVPRSCTNSAYDNPCRCCDAPPGFYCIQRRTLKTAFWPHRSRKPQPNPCTIERQREPLPNLSSWWKEMAMYEGLFALPRPTDLVIP